MYAARFDSHFILSPRTADKGYQVAPFHLIWSPSTASNERPKIADWGAPSQDSLQCKNSPKFMSELGLVSRVSPVQTAMSNCTRGEGRSFEAASQVLASNHCKLLSITCCTDMAGAS